MDSEVASFSAVGGTQYNVPIGPVEHLARVHGGGVRGKRGGKAPAGIGPEISVFKPESWNHG